MDRRRRAHVRGLAAVLAAAGHLALVLPAASEDAGTSPAPRVSGAPGDAALAAWAEALLAAPGLSVATSSLALALDGEQGASLRLDSAAPLALTVRVTSIRARDDSFAFAVDDPRPIAIEPGSSARIRVRAKNQSAAPWSPAHASRELELELVLGVELVPVERFQRVLDRPPTSEVQLSRKIEVTLAPAEGPSITLAAPKRVDVPAGTAVEIPLTLESRVSWATLHAACTLDGQAQAPVEIGPRGEVPLHYVLENAAERSRFAAFERLSRDVVLRGACKVTAVTADGTRLERGVEPVGVELVMSWKVGTSPIAVLVAALAALFGSFLWIREIRPRFTSPSLLGRLVVYEGPGEFQAVTVPLRGRTRLALEAVPREGEGVRVEGDRVVLPGTAAATAELYAEKAGKRSVMRLRTVSGGAFLFADAALGSAPVIVRRKRARFSVGPYRCRID